MPIDRYTESIESLLYQHKNHTFSSISDLEFVRSMNYDEATYPALAEKIKQQGINAVLAEPDIQRNATGQDITIFKFTDSGNQYLAAVYDSDELWRDPVILDVFILA